jgi:microsomal dipeptidase-like Zn-dependent dipeptidase
MLSSRRCPTLLAKLGLKPDEIAAVLGGNFLRVLREALTP